MSGTGNETGNGTGGTRGTGSVSGTPPGNGQRGPDRRFADEGGAGSMSGADCVGDTAGWRGGRIRQPRSTVLSQGESGGTAGQAERGEEEEGTRGDERGGSRQSCGC